jgi:hypothetical protein
MMIIKKKKKKKKKKREREREREKIKIIFFFASHKEEKEIHDQVSPLIFSHSFI